MLAETIEYIVRADEHDRRGWLQNAPVCNALARRRIAHVGAARAMYPYSVTRARLTGMFVMSCVNGSGEVLLDNRWRCFAKGYACLAPPFMPNAYRCVKGVPWEFVWVRYMQLPNQRPAVSNAMPLIAVFEGEALRDAVLGLYHEVTHTASPAVLNQWAELIDTYVRRFSEPWREDDRLHRLWEEVAADLAHDWSVTELGRRLGLSEEQLRRLCVKEQGRTPHQQLTWMRLERAAARLASSTDKVELIAHEVGYQSLFSFSNAFHKFFGARPTEYRGEHPSRHV